MKDFMYLGARHWYRRLKVCKKTNAIFVKEKKKKGIRRNKRRALKYIKVLVDLTPAFYREMWWVTHSCPKNVAFLRATLAHSFVLLWTHSFILGCVALYSEVQSVHFVNLVMYRVNANAKRPIHCWR